MTKPHPLKGALQLNDFGLRWSKALKYRAFRIQLLINVAILILLALTIPYFFGFIQSRTGSIINDPIMRLTEPVDFSVYTFLMIYSVLISGIVIICYFPERLLKSLQAYAILVLMRLVTMLLVPLEPVADLIPLGDPFIGYFFYGNTLITKDLFFSGHVSTLFLLVLCVPFRILKLIYIIATILTGVFVLLQHVHYSVDILAAPVFSWVGFKIANSIRV